MPCSSPRTTTHRIVRCRTITDCTDVRLRRELAADDRSPPAVDLPRFASHGVGGACGGQHGQGRRRQPAGFVLHEGGRPGSANHGWCVCLLYPTDIRLPARGEPFQRRAFAAPIRCSRPPPLPSLRPARAREDLGSSEGQPGECFSEMSTDVRQWCENARRCC